MFMFYVFLPIWGASTPPEPSVRVVFDACVFNCTSVCVQVLKEEKVEHYGYVNLHEALIRSGHDPAQFRNSLTRYLTSPSADEQKLANLAIGWSLYEDYTVSDLPDEAMPYFEHYLVLNGSDSRTIKSLSHKYFDRGDIGRAIQCAFQCDVVKVKRFGQPHEYVRLLYLTEDGTKTPDKKILYHASWPQNRTLAYFTYNYLRTVLRLSPEDIVRRDTQMSQYLKKRNIVIDTVQVEDIIFYWRAYSLTSDERRKYNGCAERLLNPPITEERRAVDNAMEMVVEREKRVSFVLA